MYSSDFNANITQKNEHQAIRKHQAYSSILYEDEIDFEEEDAYRSDIVFNESPSSPGWNIFKGLVGLWFGIETFRSGSRGIITALVIPDDMLSNKASHFSLSPATKNLVSNRFFWLSISSSLVALSVWIIKKSGTCLYKGICTTEDGSEYF